MGKIWYRVDYMQRMRQTERCIQEAGKGNLEFFRFLVDIAPGLVTNSIILVCFFGKYSWICMEEIRRILFSFVPSSNSLVSVSDQ